MTYNLSSPNSIVEPCDLGELDGWFAGELSRLSQVTSPPEGTVLQHVSDNLDAFVR
jgi:hypothetical protein